MIFAPDPDPNAALDGLLRSAMRHHKAGELLAAARAYDELLESRPKHAQALRLRGSLARDMNDLSISLELLRRALEVEPENPQINNELALSALALGDLAEADRHWRAALARDPQARRPLANLGALAQYRGRLCEAIDLHKRYLQLVPDDLEVQCNLVSALADAGRGDEALKLCAHALKKVPGDAHVLASRGAVLLCLQRYSEAIQVLQDATRRNPADDLALINLAQALRAEGQLDAARSVLRRAMVCNANNARAVHDLAWLLNTEGLAEAGLDHCTEFLRRHPGERLVLSAYAGILTAQGGRQEALDLLDYEGLIAVRDIECPSAFANLEEFNGALERILLVDASLLSEPVSKATQGGRQTGELDLDQEPVLECLRGVFLDAVAAYKQRMRDKDRTGHPVMVYASKDCRLRVWGTVLAAGGRQLPHLHPLGFVSGVYYVNLPPGMDAHRAHAGWLEFGGSPPEFAPVDESPVHLVEPKPGRLVIFPSYFRHATRPFSSASNRVSIAFDAMPQA